MLGMLGRFGQSGMLGQSGLGMFGKLGRLGMRGRRGRSGRCGKEGVLKPLAVKDGRRGSSSSCTKYRLGEGKPLADELGEPGESGTASWEGEAGTARALSARSSMGWIPASRSTPSPVKSWWRWT